MNSKEIQSLTKRLAANPNCICETEEKAVRDLLLDYTAGLLDPDVEQEVRELIANDPVVAMIWKEFNEIDTRVRSPEGQQWMEEAGERILSNVLSEIPQEAKSHTAHAAARFSSAPDFFTRHLETLAAAITELFTFRATLATASGEEGLERTLDDGQTRIALKSDSAGRLWLRVTSTAAAYRNGSFKFDVEPAAPVLTFSELEPGLYSARVLVDAEVAAALTKGTVPKFTPLPPSQP
jgi:anti-sigma factor RsiW